MEKMRRNFKSSLAAIYCLLNLNLSAAFGQDRDLILPKYPIDQLCQDLSFFEKALLEAHPSVGSAISRDNLSLLFDKSIKKNRHPLNEVEFRRLLSQIVANLKCGHTEVYASKQYYRTTKNNRLAFPLATRYLEDNLIVASNETSNKAYSIGDTISSINGVSIKAIISEIKRIIATDGNRDKVKNYVIDNYFPYLYRYIFSIPDTVYLTLMNADSKEKTVAIKASYETPIVTVQKDFEAKANANKGYSFDYLYNDTAIPLLTIKSFNGGWHKKFYKKVFKRINREGQKELVIDIRGNNGGKSSPPIALLSYFIEQPFTYVDEAYAMVKKPSFNRYLNWKIVRSLYFLFSTYNRQGKYYHKISGKEFNPIKKNHFNGRVYILTDGGTFSNAAIFAILAKKYDSEVAIIGEGLGGNGKSMNGFMLPTLELPNTKVRIIFPLFKIDYNSSEIKIPDIKVNPSISSFIKREDAVFKAVYDLIKCSP